MIGLTRGTVSVIKHNSAWEKEAEKCIALLAEILQKDMVDAQHIGSTAISGICAKPIIDIAVGVKEFQDILKHNLELTNQGIHYRTQEHGEQLLYICGDLENDRITHHIHVVIWNSEAWRNYLNFRDYLNCHEEEANAYAQLKQQLAALYSENRSSYTAGKQKFIDCILQKAVVWRDSDKK